MANIDHILSPTPLHDLHPSPVRCLVWKGRNEFEQITLDNVYPFDTIDTLKRLVYNHYKTPTYLPQFIFMGIPQTGDTDEKNDTEPINAKYIPVDFLWYPSGTNKPSDTFQLENPTIHFSDPRFVTRDGSFASPNYENRGRSTIEDVLLKHGDQMPEFHVYPLELLKKGEITDEIWNGQFAAYFPDVPVRGSHRPEEDDVKFGRTISSFVEKRQRTVHHLDRILRDTSELVPSRVDGIQQLRLIWKTPVDGFEGCANTFYRVPVSLNRPYIRLYPSDSAPITKLHVRGALPIPTLDNPVLLTTWTKEKTATPGTDMFTIKYVHRPSLGITQSIYGTIHVLNDGTMTLLLQPPKEMRKLDPVVDFRHFNRTVENVFQDLPQPLDRFSIKELSLRLVLNLDKSARKFSVPRLRQRLPHFSYFFKEIKKLPDDDVIMVLRYKAISQYITENEIMTFITQMLTEHKIQGEVLIPMIINSVQEEFQLTEKEAREIVGKRLQQDSEFVIQVPEDGEFTESNNPGIDIKIYSQHPLYYFQLNRVNSFESYSRIYTLLCMMFMDSDAPFRNNTDADRLEAVQEVVLHAAEHSNSNEPEPLANVIESESDSDSDDDSPFGKRKKPSVFAKAFTVPIATATALPSNVNISALNRTVATFAPKPVATTSIVEKKEEPIQVLHDAEQKLVNPQKWFLNKLYDIDKELFKFTPDKETNGYARQCASNDDRQPVIMTKMQYDRMIDEYSADNIFWVVYPLNEKDDPVQPLGTEETFTIMRYGSTGDKINYMFCPEFFCLSDEIMIRKKDFDANVDRTGKPKPVRTCPFCRGTLITNRKAAVRGATVIQRKQNKTGKYQGYIGFLGKSTHPNELPLPCCFVKNATLRIGDKEFTKIRNYLQAEKMEKASENESDSNSESDEEYDELTLPTEGIIQYAGIFASIHKRYIIEPNKHPAPGVLAAVPPYFDKFFVQNTSNDIITRVAINLKLQPNAKGFIRIGTENTAYESLLGVIAPIINKTTIREVKQDILRKIIPRVFINAHFGNFVLEFYNPANKDAMPETQQALAIWSHTNLGIKLNSENSYELIRIFNAYHNFVEFIENPSKRKDLRHIQPLLAEPGLFTENGIQLIIMEDNGGEITMKCPIFGISDRHQNNDFAFISKSTRTAVGQSYQHYELYVHTANKPARGGHVAIHDSIILWDARSRDIWPNIVTARINEYVDQCRSRYTSIYTANPEINPTTIISLSKADELTVDNISGIIKDAYNHTVAVTFPIRKGASTFVAVPIIDDGALSIFKTFNIKHIYLHWEDFPSAPLEEVVEYYAKKVVPIFTDYPGYAIESAVRKTGSDEIIAVQLRNGMYVPVAPPKNRDAVELPIVEIQEFQWNIDKQMDGIIQRNQSNWATMLEDASTEKRCGTDDIMKQSNFMEFEEIYQQFRFMVTNYIVQTPAVKLECERIIFNKDLPFFEKRKRLYIYFASVLLSWFHEDADWEASQSFLRKDCRVITNQAQCTGTCYWKEVDEKDDDVSRCMLHVRDTTSVDGSDGRLVSTSQLFTKRVIDELVYFPVRRDQILHAGVSSVAKIMQPIHRGEEYIIPESSVSWINLLRMEWMMVESDKPKYYEEMSSEPEAQPVVVNQGTLPEELRAIFPGSKLDLYIPDEQNPASPFLSLLDILDVDLEDIGMTDASLTLTRDSLVRYVTQKSVPIGIIDLPDIHVAKPEKGIFTTMLMFVRYKDRVGILLENDGENTISISLLPTAIDNSWIIVQKPQPVRKLQFIRTRPLLADVPDKPLPPHAVRQLPVANQKPIQKQKLKIKLKKETNPVEAIANPKKTGKLKLKLGKLEPVAEPVAVPTTAAALATAAAIKPKPVKKLAIKLPKAPEGPKVAEEPKAPEAPKKSALPRFKLPKLAVEPAVEPVAEPVAAPKASSVRRTLKIKLPSAPSVSAPSVTAPSVTAPSVTAPSVIAPSVTAPSVTAPSVVLEVAPSVPKANSVRRTLKIKLPKSASTDSV